MHADERHHRFLQWARNFVAYSRTQLSKDQREVLAPCAAPKKSAHYGRRSLQPKPKHTRPKHSRNRSRAPVASAGSLSRSSKRTSSRREIKRAGRAKTIERRARQRAAPNRRRQRTAARARTSPNNAPSRNRSQRALPPCGPTKCLPGGPNKRREKGGEAAAAAHRFKHGAAASARRRRHLGCERRRRARRGRRGLPRRQQQRAASSPPKESGGFNRSRLAAFLAEGNGRSRTLRALGPQGSGGRARAFRLFFFLMYSPTVRVPPVPSDGVCSRNYVCRDNSVTLVCQERKSAM